jgi:single-strand DNA-binding protein
LRPLPVADRLPARLHVFHAALEGKIQHSEYKGVKTDTIRVTSILKLDRAERVAGEEEFDEISEEDVAA